MFDPYDRSPAAIEDAYQRWARRLVADEWVPYLFSFMFKPIGGNVAVRAKTMNDEIERVYRMHLPGVVRHPRAPSALKRLPIWLCCPDFPVFKHRRGSLIDAIVNDGQHSHAVAFYSPQSRLYEGVDTHFVERQSRYVLPGYPLDRLDVSRVTHDVGYVTGYSRKAVVRGLVDNDATLVLPRAMVEFQDRAL